MPIFLSTPMAMLAGTAAAQADAPAKPAPIVVAGIVPDEAGKAAILARLRELYGFDRVVDQIAIGSVVAPPNWHAHVQKLLAQNLKLVGRGQLNIDGTAVSIRGEVANEAQRQQIASEIAANLNASYTVSNGLKVAAQEQGILDATLGKRIVEFERGQAALTASGKRILDEMVAALLKFGDKKVEVVGHTDNSGARVANLALSQARAEAVKLYLAEKGVNAATIAATGMGPDRPVADNASNEGRARNRRIEFRMAQ